MLPMGSHATIINHLLFSKGQTGAHLHGMFRGIAVVEALKV